jgi:hypothetical protein
MLVPPLRRACGLIVALAAGSAVAAQPSITIENEFLEVRYEPEAGELSVHSKSAQRDVLRRVKLNGQRGAAAVAAVADAIHGSGHALKLAYANGGGDSVTLFEKLPFALFRSTVKNDDDETKVMKSERTWSALLDVGRPAAEVKTFGTGGLLGADKNPGSYAWLAVADPESRAGLVFGTLSHERGSGVWFTRVEEDAVGVDAQLDYGRLAIPAGDLAELETLAVGYFDDVRLGLEAWADAVARVHKVRLPTQPAGYCTWYSKPHGGASDEKHLAELSDFAAKELAPLGFSVVQIDDKWQAGVSTNGPRRNFTTHDPEGPYPAGMKAAADHISSLGLTPGLWFMPLAGTHYDPFFKDHQDWFVKRENGEPYETKWGGTCLDLTNPAAREHVRSVAHRIAHDWGFRYLKLDGLWTGTATPLRYVNSGYQADDIGDAVFHDPTKTNIEAYRSGLRLVREAVGPDVFLLGCNGPQNMRSYSGAFGLVDAMRVGPDNNADWKRLVRGPEFGSRHYFLHGRVWYNDPDPVYVRGSMPLKHAQLICSWVAFTGQLNLSSEWLPGLPPERVDLLKRTMPAHGLKPRPADLLEHDPPRLWLLTDDRGEARRDVIGVFNWDSREREFDYPLEKLGLNGSVEYVAFDYWANEPVPIIKSRLNLIVPGESCVIHSVRPRTDHPLLLSTSRHVTQGIVDVTAETWDAELRTLRGESHVVGGDPYELRIALPTEKVAEVSPSSDGEGIESELAETTGLVRVTIKSAKSQPVRWSVRFK